MVAEIATVRIVLAILAVANHHVHFISQFGETAIRPTIGQLKAAATRSANKASFRAPSLWSRGCHMESLDSEEDFLTSYQYVEQHGAQGAVVHKWDANIEWKI